ncbi:hypothetical protein HHI36_021887 [Cryptolaemus montrouzieri]|uniref:LIM zinc-binding domain-containing protein n=1 Tax=Cryptolaemus montrouzieri TaxID=559131 RepID=A0ABD2MZ04_9CUCU
MNLRDKHYNVNDLGSGNNTNEVKENYNPNNKRFLTEDVQEPRGSNLRDINYDSNLYENIPVSPKNVLAHDQMKTFSGGLRDVLYPTNPYGNSNIKNLVPSAFVPIKHSDMNYNDDSYSHGLDQGNVRELPYPSQFINNQFKHGKNLPNYNPGSYAIFNEHQNPAYFEPIKDLRYSQNQNISESPELEAQVPLSNSYKARDGGMNKNLGYTQYPSEMSKMNDLSVGSGEIKEGAGNLYGSQEPMTNISYNQEVPVRNIARSEAAKAQLPFSSNPHLINTVPYSRNDVLEENSGLVKQSNSPLPHLMGGKTNLYEDAQIPAKIKNIKDLAYSTYDAPPEEQEDFHNLSVKDRLNLIKKGELPSFRPKNSSVSDYNLSPNKFNMKDDIAGYNRSSSPSSRQGYDNSSPMRHKENISQQLAHRGVTEDLSIQDPNLTKNFPSPNKVNTKNNDPMKEIVHSNRPLNSPSGRKHENLPSYASGTKSIHEDNLQPSFIPIGGIRDIQYEDPEIRTALSKDNDLFEGSTPNKFIPNTNLAILPCCHYCKQKFKQDELAIAIPERSDAIYHTECFKCHGCNQILADMFYFYDKESDNIYCGRDYAKIRGIPRCKACDELIFVKEYCLAENSTFHVKHFCCFECDKPLAGQNYVMENDQPVCVPCYELTKANKCYACKEVIHPDQQGLQLKDGVHFHATDDCFACKVCKKALFGAKLLFRKDCLYCSHDCYNSDV